MRRTGNWWIGVAAGLVLGVAAIVAVDQASEPASAQGSFSVTPAQLKINQRISQAAVRRSNESLDLLDPIRKSGAQDDAPGWGTPQLRDGAVTSQKLSTAVREAQPRWAVVAATTGTLTRGRGVATSAKLPTLGYYTVAFDRDVTQCAIQATLAAGDTTVTPVGEISAWHTADTPASVTVRTADSSGDDVNTLPFQVAVLC
jgi:hypothetical protein